MSTTFELSAAPKPERPKPEQGSTFEPDYGTIPPVGRPSNKGYRSVRLMGTVSLSDEPPERDIA